MGNHRKKKGQAKKPATSQPQEPADVAATVEEVQTSSIQVEQMPEIVADVKAPEVPVVEVVSLRETKHE